VEKQQGNRHFKNTQQHEFFSFGFVGWGVCGGEFCPERSTEEIP
jgi:hypothetical protein